MGAGMAGMAAAWELSSQGFHDILVLESQKFIGGKLKTMESKIMDSSEFVKSNINEVALLRVRQGSMIAFEKLNKQVKEKPVALSSGLDYEIVMENPREALSSAKLMSKQDSSCELSIRERERALQQEEDLSGFPASEIPAFLMKRIGTQS